MEKKEIPGTSIRKAEPIQLEVTGDPTPMDLIKMAVSKDMDIEKLERLMALQKEWKAQKAKEAFNAAYSRFQSIVPDMQKNRKVDYKHKNDNDRTTYNYQDLGSISKHIKESLSESGLAYRWEQEEIGDEVSVCCIVTHADGHEERGKALKGKADASGGKSGIHAKASTITYLKRYTLVAILGLSSSEMDDDGQLATKGGAENPDLSVGDDSCPMIKDEEFKTTMKKVMGGEMTVEHVLKNRRLTPSQHTALETAEKAAALKKS
jgi:uncharacterized protein YktA (UPF0223 family)